MHPSAAVVAMRRVATASPVDASDAILKKDPEQARLDRQQLRSRGTSKLSGPSPDDTPEGRGTASGGATGRWGVDK